MTPNAYCGDSPLMVSALPNSNPVASQLVKRELDRESRRMLRAEQEKCLEAAKLGGVRRFRTRLKKISNLEKNFWTRGLEDLHCAYLKALALEKNANDRLLLREEILFLDVYLVSKSSFVSRSASGDGYQWDRAFLRDFEHARKEILAQSLSDEERMRFLVVLTLAYLNYDWLRSHSGKELELQALEQRRGLEKLAYATIDRIVATISGAKGSAGCHVRVAQDIKVFYHFAFDAAARERLEALGRLGDLTSLIQEASVANEIKRKCQGAAPRESFQQYLRAAELYGRLGLESEVLFCLQSAKALISQLEKSDRSSAYLLIDQKQREYLDIASGFNSPR